MRNFFKQLKKAGVYPFIPIVPLTVLGSALALSALSFVKVRRLARALESPSAPAHAM